MTGAEIVSTHSIRYRILKDRYSNDSHQAQAHVSTHSIRYRILKGTHQGRQDTSPQGVSTHSIRYRILKATTDCCRSTTPTRFNPFDPIQDTESAKIAVEADKSQMFQPIRSDTGY